MKSNYKKLGDYIIQKGELNKELITTNLLGISNNKYFVKAKSNLNGIDLSKYRIVERNQFAFNRATTRNGDKISIALGDGDICIVSPSYRIFEVKDENELDPKYLMMWFRRPEFDRYARFKSHGSAHEFFDYDEMCNVALPIPSIEKQREIVREYNVVSDRITLNEKLTQKLEDTIQTIYKQWFVDFEFPISKTYAESIGRPELEGKPYKSSGGEFKFCGVFEQEIPAIFGTVKLDDVIDKFVSNRGKSKSRMYLQDFGDSYTHPVISAMNVKGNSLVKLDTISYVDKEDFDDWMPNPLKSGDLIMTSEAPLGELMYIPEKCDFVLSQRLFGLKPSKEMKGTFLYLALQSHLFKLELEGRASGTTVLGIKLSELKNCMVIKPSQVELNAFDSVIHKLLSHRRYLDLQNQELSLLKSLLLTRLTKA